MTHSTDVLTYSASAFPFSAIVGQQEVKQSLLIAAVDPAIGGVLIFGDRGTGKSTAIRGLAALLPSMETPSDCCAGLDPNDEEWLCESCRTARQKDALAIKQVPVPVVDLPLGATEDRVVGAFDIEWALSHGEKKFEPGLLASAHRGFLYVDEVNLLEDHIVDILLDVASSGINVVEREGISERHPSRFVLIGSGNPEEGELRPQLLDRFGLSVEVRTPNDLTERVEVVSRRDQFEFDRKAFVAKWQPEDAKIREKIVAARTTLHSVEVDQETRKNVAQLCVELGTDGLRGDMTLMRAARALAALSGERRVTEEHIVRIAAPALRHRLRRDPLDESGSSSRIDRVVSRLFEENAA